MLQNLFCEDSIDVGNHSTLWRLWVLLDQRCFELSHQVKRNIKARISEVGNYSTHNVTLSGEKSTNQNCKSGTQNIVGIRFKYMYWISYASYGHVGSFSQYHIEPSFNNLTYVIHESVKSFLFPTLHYVLITKHMVWNKWHTQKIYVATTTGFVAVIVFYCL